MALVQDSTGLFLEPTTGQYYSPFTAPRMNSNQFGMMGGGMFGNQGGNNFIGGRQPSGTAEMYGNTMMGNRLPKGLINFDGRSFVPFTGDMAGISQGKRSVVDAMMGSRQPFQYNTPSIADLFPMMQGNMQAPMQNMQPSSGAGRFMGGLLGNMPTPVSSETTQAPSSGAGRFL